jgi:hypothetical protein
MPGHHPAVSGNYLFQFTPASPAFAVEGKDAAIKTRQQS